MLSGILLIFILLLGIHWIVAVNMCTNGSTVSTDVTLRLLNGTGVNGCYCSVKLYNSDTIGSYTPKIVYEVKYFSGCKYELVISYNNTRQRFSCYINNTIFHVINKTDEIKLYLESTTTDQDDTTFEVKITSSVTAIGGPLLRLNCYTPNSNTYTPSSTQTTIKQTSATARTITTSTPYTLSSREVISTTVPLSTTRSTKAIKDQDDDDDDVVTVGIISGVTGGVIGGVIGGVSVFIIIYLVKKKRKKNSTSEVYSSPSQHHQPESQYTDLQLS